MVTYRGHGKLQVAARSINGNVKEEPDTSSRGSKTIVNMN